MITKRHITPEDIARRTTYHAPSSERIVEGHQRVRAIIAGAMTDLNDLVPDGREKAVAFTKLEEAMMFATAGIARSGHLFGDDPK